MVVLQSKSPVENECCVNGKGERVDSTQWRGEDEWEEEKWALVLP